MGNQDDNPGGVPNNAEDVNQPDNQVDAPNSGDNQGADSQPDNQPKGTDADQAEQDAILPDDSSQEGKQPSESNEGTDQPKENEDGESGESEGSDTEQKPPEKEQKREGYLQRKLKEKDEVIENLTNALEDNYVNQGKDDTDKRVRSIEAERYVERIGKARSSLVTDNQRVSSKIPEFTPGDPKYVGDDRVAGIMARYAQDNVVMQQLKLPDGKVSNEIVGYRTPLFDYMSDMADFLRGDSNAEPTGEGQPKPSGKDQSQENGEMDAKAEVPTGSVPKPKSDKKDDFEAGFDSVQ